MILVIINFVVVTKGAGRIVGGQRALHPRRHARQADGDRRRPQRRADRRRTRPGARRAEVAQEADFYGAMDGASKFVRGDAVAGILILFINIDRRPRRSACCSTTWPSATPLRNYTLLTIGDGLVAQIPALLLSIGRRDPGHARRHRAGHGPSRSSRQMFGNPRVLARGRRGARRAWALMPGHAERRVPDAGARSRGAAWY
ncbi:MAG: FHIPEP family type III secretion protein [Chromatiales bacterium]|nr:FHIPEP family type III secretion protein [Chromatiales bacterium]